MKSNDPMDSTRSTTSGGLLKFSVAAPPALVAQLNELAARKHQTRTATMLQLIELGLQQQQRIDELIAAAGTS